MTHDNSSILSYLADKQRFTNGTEDIATEVLGYILSKSASARNALSDTLRVGGANVGQLAQVNTQVTGDDGARPDLVGRDEEGSERVLIEAKFWAGLTDNQPNTYLNRLPNDGKPAVLLFVAPEARLETLWPEVLRKQQVGRLGIDVETADIKSAVLDGSERRMLLTSWRRLLRRMSWHANEDGEKSVEADLRQLDALCDREDTHAFLPLRSEELGPQFARRIPHLLRLADDAYAHEKVDKFITSNDRIYSSVDGHGRYLWFVNDVPVWFGVVYSHWAKRRDTPIWLILRDTQFSNAASIDEIRRRVQPLFLTNPPGVIDSGTDLLVPIHLPTGVEYDAVLDSVVDQVRQVAQLLMGRRRRKAKP